MSQVREKLQQVSGETIVETLVALLVCIFAIVILTTSVTVSVNIDQMSAAHDRQVASDENTAAENGTKAGTVLFTATDGSGSQSYPVYYSQGSNLSSYSSVEKAS